LLYEKNRNFGPRRPAFLVPPGSTKPKSRPAPWPNRLFLPFLLVGVILAFVASAWGCGEEAGKLLISCFRLGEPLSDWKLEKKEGSPVFQLEKEGDIVALELKSDRSSFGFSKEISVDLKEYPYLNWRWRVSVLPHKGDTRKKKTDDAAGQLYVLFPRGLTRLGLESINYYWDNLPPKGTTGVAPTWKKTKIVVLRSREDELNTWYTEKRNVYEDYKKLFGQEPPTAGGLVIYINSQHTKSKAEASWAEIFFSKN